MSKKIKIAIGCDHIVTNIKNQLAELLKEEGFEIIDVGTHDNVRTHYPIYGQQIAMKVSEKQVDFGIAICGTGIGITNSVNKIKGVRCALVKDFYTAKRSREQYDANIIGFGGMIVGLHWMLSAVKEFVNTKYKGENNEEINFLDSLSHQNESVSFHCELDKWSKGEYNN